MCRFALKKGTNTVGTAIESDIYLPCAGVSRRHAFLRVDASTVNIEDRGSKNGTFVNGTRVLRSAARPGDQVRLGPVDLRLEEVEADDAEYAITTPSKGSGVSAPVSPPALAGVLSPEPGVWEVGWVDLIHDLSGALLGPDGADLQGVLEELRLGLGAEAACLVVWDGVERPTVMHVAGRLSHLSVVDASRPTLSAVRAAGRTSAVLTSFVLGEEPPVAFAVAAGPTLPMRALVLVGSVPGMARCGPLLETVLRLLLHAQPEHLALAPATDTLDQPQLAFPEGYVVGASAAIGEVHRQLLQLVRGDIPVLITGETGVGKELVAQILHRSSRRADGPFEAVHCAAIPAELLEAELFGIERGVATGVTKRPGQFHLADGGLLFLDEIGDMPMALQAKLLRVLQGGQVQAIGAARPQPVDVRVVAATNHDLVSLIAAGQFRSDLYYRIAGFTLNVPPLRERREDIPALIEHFIERFAGELGKRVRGVTVRALKALVDAPWPGNVRELEHEVRRMVYQCSDGLGIDSSLLSDAVLSPVVPAVAGSLPANGDLGLGRRVAELERTLITVALGRAHGNRSGAARLLGLSRNGLAGKLVRLGIRE